MGECKFRVVSLPGKGQGIVATATVEPGELLVAEQPLVVVPWWAKQLDGEPYAGARVKELVEEAVERLPKVKQERFFQLHDSKCQDGEDKTAMGIWRTNNFCLGRSGAKTDNGLFDALSRFNHSCAANAEFHWNPTLKRQEIRAIKRIRPDAEITLCYVTGVTLSQSTSARREYLKTSYGFHCACAACVDGEDDPESDRLRAEVAEATEAISKLVYFDEDDPEANDSDEKIETDLREALEIAERQFRLMTNLGYKVVSRLDVISLILDLSSELGDRLTSRFYYQTGLKLSRTLYGSASTFTLDFEKKYSKLK